MSLLAFAAAASLAVQAAPACSTPAPDVDTANWEEGRSSYAMRKRVADALTRAFGELRGDLTHEATLAEQVREAIAVPGEASRLDPATWVVSGCRPHSCQEKALAVYDAACDRVELAALIHYPGRAFRQPAVSVFKLQTARYDALEPVALAWARDEVDLEEIRRVAFPGRD